MGREGEKKEWGKVRSLESAQKRQPKSHLFFLSQRVLSCRLSFNSIESPSFLFFPSVMGFLLSWFKVLFLIRSLSLQRIFTLLLPSSMHFSIPSLPCLLSSNHAFSPPTSHTLRSRSQRCRSDVSTGLQTWRFSSSRRTTRAVWPCHGTGARIVRAMRVEGRARTFSRSRSSGS